MLDKRNGSDGTLRSLMESIADENLQGNIICSKIICSYYGKGQTETCAVCSEAGLVETGSLTNATGIKIEGVGKDAETYTNAAGGQQSKSPSALHLVDPVFLAAMVRLQEMPTSLTKAVEAITDYMCGKGEQMILTAINQLCPNNIKALFEIGKVLQYGATEGNNGKGYPIGNWRLINREEHLNHALVHILSLLAGDTQDDHKEHALCRLHMAMATRETEGFSYTEPAK